MNKVVTMMKLEVALVLVGLVMLTEASKDVVMEMSKTFAKPFAACKKEMELPESVVNDFMNFWKSDYQLTDRSTGCALICLSSKLELLDGEYKLHHDNAHAFARNHGADDAMAKQLIEMVHGCSLTYPEIPDSCERMIDIANCFRAGIHKLEWAPSMELIIAEILAET